MRPLDIVTNKNLYYQRPVTEKLYLELRFPSYRDFDTLYFLRKIDYSTWRAITKIESDYARIIRLLRSGL